MAILDKVQLLILLVPFLCFSRLINRFLTIQVLHFLQWLFQEDLKRLSMKASWNFKLLRNEEITEVQYCLFSI
jgi:hypothetical protein